MRRVLPILLIFSLVARASEPHRGDVQDFGNLLPPELHSGRIVMEGQVVHRAVGGEWIKLKMHSQRGAFTYLITRLDSEGGGIALEPETSTSPSTALDARKLEWRAIRAGDTRPLRLEGDITDRIPGSADWVGRFAFGGQIERLHFTLVENRPRGSEPPPTFANVAYGPAERQILDVYLVKSRSPTPVAVYIHGGAWTSGDKSDLANYRAFLDAGISVVAIDYRYCPPENPSASTPAVAVPLRDAARAIQFIRSRSVSWGLDGNRLGIWGISAGACTALWLATHPDLADPRAQDPIARESTRPRCVAALLAQTSLDPREMRAWVGPELTYGAQAFAISAGRRTLDFERFLAARERVLPWIAQYSPSALLTSSAAPMFLDYLDFSLTPCEPLESYYTHSPRFGVGFYDRARRMSQECHLRFEGREDPLYGSWQAFLLSKLGITGRRQL